MNSEDVVAKKAGRSPGHPLWLLAAVVLGDGLFVVLQVPSPSFMGFGLTPIPLLIAETLAYLLGGLIAYQLGVHSSRLFYFASFAIVVATSLALAFLPVPETLAIALQLVVYIFLALLNLCWGVCFASFKPSVSIILIIGAYVLWGAFSFCISITVGTGFGEVLQIAFPLTSLIILGFCLAKLSFGVNQRRFDKKEEQPGALSVFRSVGALFWASTAFALIFGSILEIDVLFGNEGFIVSPGAQIGSIVICLAMLVYVLATGAQIRYRLIIIVALVLATILMARAILESQSFFTSGLPMAIFNFYGMIVWIVFAWKAYESRVNSFCIFALGLGSMRLGLLAGRSLTIVLANYIGLSWETVQSISILGLWILFICVIVAVWFVMMRQRNELLPFEQGAELGVRQGVGYGTGQGARQGAGQGFEYGAGQSAGQSSEYGAGQGFEQVLPKRGFALLMDQLAEDKDTTTAGAGPADAAPSATLATSAMPAIPAQATAATTAQEPSLYEKRFAEAVSGCGLTEREIEILSMYASGRSAVYIAEELYLSNYTVKTHLRRSYAKLGVHTRQELLDMVWKSQLPEG